MHTGVHWALFATEAVHVPTWPLAGGVLPSFQVTTARVDEDAIQGCGMWTTVVYVWVAIFMVLEVIEFRNEGRKYIKNPNNYIDWLCAMRIISDRRPLGGDGW